MLGPYNHVPPPSKKDKSPTKSKLNKNIKIKQFLKDVNEASTNYIETTTERSPFKSQELDK